MPAIEEFLGTSEFDLAPGLRAAWSKGRVDVTFPNGRGQTIRYRRQGELYLFTSGVARPSSVKEHGRNHLARRILERNRATEVIGFRMTKAGGVEAFLRHRADTLQREELIFFLTVLAREADRFEYLLTGHDRH